MLNKTNVELERLEKLNKKYLKDDKNTVLRHALSNAAYSDVLHVLEEENNIEQKFSIENKVLPITNQKQSGRCWIFAALNVLREIVAKELKLTDFELSQNYIAFYDKLEKVNYALNSVIELIDKEHDDRELMFVLQTGINDGGQWDMFTNIVRKYGIVPKQAFKETWASSHTREIDSLLNSVVRKFAADVHKLYVDNKTDEINKLKDEIMDKVYTLMCSSFGVPPKKFNFDYVDKDGKYHVLNNQTPLGFFNKFVGDKINDYVSIIHAPTKDKEYGKRYTIRLLGNVEEGHKVIHLNLPMERIKELCIKTLENGELVWFGSDVGFYGNRTLGAWDDKLFDYESAFGLDLKFDKADMLDYHASAMNHAMVIVGVNVQKGQENKWKIQNSWGVDSGEKGFYVMSNSWFDRFVYQAVIDKKYLSSEELKALEAEPIVVPPWDPMGTLAD